MLANVNGVYNAIFVKGDLIGENLFYGKGAGADPTSSSVVSDIAAIARHISETSGTGKAAYIGFKKDVEGIKKMDAVKTRYYIRLSAIDRPGVLARISGVLAKYRISIASVSQKERKASKIVPIVMMTHESLERDMASAIKEIDRLGVIRKRSVRIRVEG
jgi:homoserine dehydrogenase